MIRVIPEPVSVVMPVRNEEPHLEAAVGRVLDQEYAGELEVVLAVGPGRDRTREIADSLAAADDRIVVVDNPTGLTPAGLNLAIEVASHEIIVRVDGHAELCPGYIATAVKTLRETGAANVGGLMDARGRTAFEQAVAAAYNSHLGLGGGGFHLAATPPGPADTVFLGVFRRDILKEVGGFDESLHRAQDWELNYRIRCAGHLVWFTPDLRVVYRPRSSLRTLAKQFHLTGRWRREVIRRHPETASSRYLAPPATVLGTGVGLGVGLTGLWLRKPWLVAMLLFPVLYLGFLVFATLSMRGVPAAARIRLPMVLATMHLAWGTGFLRGLPRRG